MEGKRIERARRMEGVGGDLRMVARVWWWRGWVGAGLVLRLEAMVLL